MLDYLSHFTQNSMSMNFLGFWKFNPIYLMGKKSVEETLVIPSTLSDWVEKSSASWTQTSSVLMLFPKEGEGPYHAWDWKPPHFGIQSYLRVLYSDIHQ